MHNVMIHVQPPNAVCRDTPDMRPLVQIGYALGDTGRSFVVGFGQNPPQFAHHRGASCPTDMAVPCTWDAFNSKSPNPNIVYGGLVGGPDGTDEYTDARDNYEQNEVALDYNAGFAGEL